MTLVFESPLTPSTCEEVLAHVRHRVEAMTDELRFHFHHLHRHPELSWQENGTAEYVEDYLTNLGLEPRRMAETGVVVDLTGSEQLPRRALRCDLDAIPVHEATGIAHASARDGVMHACGHDVHTAVLLGAAKVLSGLGEERRRPVRLIFQPAEEVLPSGSQRLIDEGVLHGVCDIVTLHVWPALPTGSIGVRDGAMTAAADSFRVELRGPGGHGARPYETVDLVALAARVVTSVLEIPRMRLHPERQPAVVSFGSVHGGETFNVIPDRVVLQGTVRTLDATARDTIHAGMRSTIEDLCHAAGATHELTIECGPPAVANDARLARLARQVGGSLFGDDHVVELDLPSMGSEDFGHYLEHVPGILIRLGSTPAGATRHPLHSSQFSVGDEALPVGAMLMAAFGAL